MFACCAVAFSAASVPVSVGVGTGSCTARSDDGSQPSTPLAAVSRAGNTVSPSRAIVPELIKKVPIALFSSEVRVGHVAVGHTALAEPHSTRRPNVLVTMQSGSAGSTGDSIEPELSTNSITLGLSRLLATIVLSVVCATKSGTTRSKS